MRLTLIRHGPTRWNETRRFQGRTDLPLTDLGRRQARAVAAALRPNGFARIYSSPLARALETANIVAAAHAMPVTPDARLREFDFGDWEGLTWREIVAANPQLAGLGSTAARLYAPPNGESFGQVCSRAQSFLDEIVALGQDAAAVAHAGTLHALIEVLGLTPAGEPDDNLSFRFTPGGITRIAIDGERRRLIGCNETEHLDAAG